MEIKLFVIIAICLSCNTGGEKCDRNNLKELKIAAANTILRLPPFVIKDTIKYGGPQIIFRYNVLTIDSSLTLYASVKNYEKDPVAVFDIDGLISDTKESLVRETPDLQLVSESFKKMDNIKIGYFKFLNLKRNRYDGGIFFYRGKRLVQIWIYERVKSENEVGRSLTDCVFENLQIN